MRKLLLLTMLLGMFLSGCQVAGHWTKKDFNTLQWRKDYYHCSVESKIICQYNDWILCWRDNMIDCLSAEGYHYVKD